MTKTQYIRKIFVMKNIQSLRRKQIQQMFQTILSEKLPTNPQETLAVGFAYGYSLAITHCKEGIDPFEGTGHVLEILSNTKTSENIKLVYDYLLSQAKNDVDTEIQHNNELAYLVGNQYRKIGCSGVDTSEIRYRKVMPAKISIQSVKNMENSTFNKLVYYLTKATEDEQEEMRDWLTDEVLCMCNPTVKRRKISQVEG